MSRSKIFLFSVVLLFFTSICSLATLSQTSSSTPPQYSVGPITDYSAAQPDFRDVLRFRRGERYNSPDSPLPELGDGRKTVPAVSGGNYFGTGLWNDALDRDIRSAQRVHDLALTQSRSVVLEGDRVMRFIMAEATQAVSVGEFSQIT
jgi:hypothetical protein